MTLKGNDAVGGFDTNTGLVASDVFYFGSMVGDTFEGTPSVSFVVNVNDEIGARNHVGFLQPVTNIYDFTKDGVVNVNDALLARAHTAFMTRINIPAAGQPAAPAATPAMATDDGSESEVAPVLSTSNEDALAAERDSIESALAVRQAAATARPASPPVGWLRNHLERVDASHAPKPPRSTAMADSDAQRAKIAQETADGMAEVLGRDDPLLDSLLEDIRFD